MRELKKVYIKPYGCQQNVYDAERMVDLLSPHGFALTDELSNADVTILNTCHIREKAEQKVFSDLGRIKLVKDQRKLDGKNMVIAVGGCVGQAEGKEIIKSAPYVSMVFGPQTYHRLPEMLEQISRNEKKKLVDTEFPIDTKFDYLPLPTATTTSQFVSIQEGCDRFCTYCVVPYTRGAEYSRPAEKIIEEIKHLADQGVIEITLVGQNVNDYNGLGSNGSELNLGKLLFMVADECPEIIRIRYTTSHPNDMHDELYKAHAEIPAVMPYLHLPVQSGSNNILQSMNRKHTVSEYLKVMEKLRVARPDIAFSSDFIVGFPGESDHDFKQTLEIVNEVKYAQAYSFKYSRRPGTPAAAMDLQVEEQVKVERLKVLQDVLNNHQLDFNKKAAGLVMPVLFDRKGKHHGQIIGKSPYMQSVYINNAGHLPLGKIYDVIIKEGHANSLSGEDIEEKQVNNC